LVTFDPTSPEADLGSLTTLRNSLLKENQFYTTAVSSSSQGEGLSDLGSLTRLRAALIAENEFYKAQVNG
jgi:HlyD family secretion protein